jgi:hypothetical protein
MGKLHFRKLKQKILYKTRSVEFNMEKSSRDQKFFEAHPELEVKLRELRKMARELGLLGKIKFS